jgi:CRP-like cAMP-binding protein/cytochrome P450
MLTDIHTSELPPLVPGWPLIGNTLDLAAEPIQFWVNAARKYGPAYRVRYPTAPNGEMIVLAGLEANRLATRQGHLFSNSQYFHRLSAETGTDNYMCAMDGEDHAYFRKVMKPALSRETLTPIVSDLIRMVEQETATWREGEVFQATERLQRITVNGLAYAAGGCPMPEGEYKDLCRFSKFFIGAGAAGWPSFLLKLPFYKKAKDAVHGFLKNMLADHERQKPGVDRRADILDLVLQAKYADGQPFNEADRLANAHLPYANGITYTGRIGGFLLYELFQRPEILARLVAEVDGAYANGTPTMRELRNMTTLRNCVKEILRHRPIAPAVPRYVLQTFQFAGHKIPAGSFVFFAVCVPHFDPQYFADPFTFDPDRYLPPRSEAMRSNAYAAYGLGTHACLSIGLVETITMITMIGLLRTTELSLQPKNYKMRIVVNPMPGPGNVRLRVERKRQHGTPASQAPALDVESTLGTLGLSPEAASRLAHGVIRRPIEGGTTIIRQGDAAEAFYVVAEGAVEVVKEKQDGPDQVLAKIGPGGYFGEIGLLHGVPRTATVRATGAWTVVLEIGRELFTYMAAEHDLVSDEIAEMARRRVMVNQLAEAVPTADRGMLSKVSAHITRQSFAPREVVIRQGGDPDKFYVIVSGTAEVVNHHFDGEDILLATLGPGDYFGEIGILKNQPRMATVRAVGDLEVLALEREHFLALKDADHRTGQSIAEKAVQRLLAATS